MRLVFWLTVLSGCSFEVSGLSVGGPELGPRPADGAGPTRPDAGPQLPSMSQPEADAEADASAATAAADAADAAAEPDLAPRVTATRIGDACDPADAPCSKGQECATQDLDKHSLPGGYCTQDCRTKACPAGAQCSRSSFLGGVTTDRSCFESCPPKGCRAGYKCCTKGWAAPGVCLTDDLCDDDGAFGF